MTPMCWESSRTRPRSCSRWSLPCALKESARSRHRLATAFDLAQPHLCRTDSPGALRDCIHLFIGQHEIDLGCLEVDAYHLDAGAISEPERAPGTFTDKRVMDRVE